MQGRWGGSWKGWGKGIHDQNILYENNLFLIKMKKTLKSNSFFLKCSNSFFFRAKFPNSIAFCSPTMRYWVILSFIHTSTDGYSLYSVQSLKEWPWFYPGNAYLLKSCILAYGPNLRGITLDHQTGSFIRGFQEEAATIANPLPNNVFVAC